MRTRISATAVLALSLLCLPALADDFQPQPNTIKYKDSGAQAAKGRSGNATIEARVLLNMDGTADIEITTGQFEPYVAGTGIIERVQIRAAGADPVNYNNTGGGDTFTISRVSGLAHNQAVEVTAHVTGVDGSRTGVVTVSTTAKLRPNLTFTWIKSKQHALIGMPVSVTAIVSETNLDSGARADCVLRDSGAEVDRASNIWVDAGGSVTCMLTAVFETAGAKSLTVNVENIRPGDYDPSDNSVAAAELYVHDYNEEFWEWSATAREENSTSSSVLTAPNYGGVYNSTSWTAYYGIDATQPELLDMSTLRFSYRAETDGRVLVDVSDVPFTGYRNGSGRRCGRASVSGITATACTMILSEPFAPWSEYDVYVQAGDVTYYGEEWSRSYNPQTGTYQYYTFNYSGRDVYGPQEHLGSTVVQNLAIGDATRTLFANPAVTLTPYESHTQQTRCFGSQCEVVTTDRVGKSGTASGGLSN